MHRIAYNSRVISNVLIGGDYLLRRIFIRLDPHPPGQHRHLRALRLQTHFKLGAQYPRFTAVSLHHKRLARVGHVKKRHAPAKLYMALTPAKVNGNGTVSIQRDLGLIGQSHSSHLPRRSNVIRAQIIDPTPGLPARQHAHHHQQAGRDR